jgi:DNA mismatch repair protein MLH1
VPDITAELGYQQVLRRFAAFAPMTLSSPAPLKELLQMELEAEACRGNGPNPDEGSIEEIAEAAAQLLSDKAPMLKEYFAIHIDTQSQQLVALPVVLDQYTPDLTRLPRFTLALANEVNWEVGG